MKETMMQFLSGRLFQTWAYASIFIAGFTIGIWLCMKFRGY